MADDKAFMKAVQDIDAAIPDQGGTGAASLAAPSLEQICALLKKIKGPLGVILPIIERIPIWGGTVAKALRLLLQLGDVVCPK